MKLTCKRRCSECSEIFCTKELAPVCGTNGKESIVLNCTVLYCIIMNCTVLYCTVGRDYANPCMATSSGVKIKCRGKCPCKYGQIKPKPYDLTKPNKAKPKPYKGRFQLIFKSKGTGRGHQNKQ